MAVVNTEVERDQIALRHMDNRHGLQSANRGTSQRGGGGGEENTAAHGQVTLCRSRSATRSPIMMEGRLVFVRVTRAA